LINHGGGILGCAASSANRGMGTAWPLVKYHAYGYTQLASASLLRLTLSITALLHRNRRRKPRGVQESSPKSRCMPQATHPKPSPIPTPTHRVTLTVMSTTRSKAQCILRSNHHRAPLNEPPRLATPGWDRRAQNRVSQHPLSRLTCLRWTAQTLSMTTA
jgi:hypothetical protein